MELLLSIIDTVFSLEWLNGLFGSLFEYDFLGTIQASAEADDDAKEIPFLNQDWFDYADFMKLLVRFLLNIVVVLILVRYIYYPSAKRKDFLFTYFMIGIVVFILCFTLENVKLELGFALGLFAIFGIIRYRTDAIPIKEMTYLFIVIGLSVMNALINKKVSLVEMLFANGAIIFVTYGLERIWLMRHEMYKVVLYDNIEMLQSGKREELLEDLHKRTGIKISRILIRKIDLLRDTVQINVYFYEDEQEDYADEMGTS